VGPISFSENRRRERERMREEEVKKRGELR